ncbi:NAD(P)-binding protein [Luteolibacter yonseiensis]|uniref:NAD(P)-binding protein n=1 Tax=Luteolibacter yonseiensis TaxID=1144680 RepID=A0A934R2Z2_9BACT|nr:UDP-galactopyranose mutase [Luteolibacter yonseiensis]MBK1815128.1 NAD(P)-binding protein [Luteolibacter yonseiensis]
MKVIITGAGLSGTVAAVLLKRAGHRVEIYETRPHIAGNCHDGKTGGVTVHTYGPHLFHTNNTMVWNFLSRFTAWNGYQVRVVADTALGRIPIPWSLASADAAGRDLTDSGIRDLIFRDYSEKQWGIPFAELPDAIRNRVPLRRDNHDTRYFTDRHQGQPADGFTAMFTRMLEGIPVHLGVPEGLSMEAAARADLHIYTGKIDSYFRHRHGRLPYRSLRFEHTRSATRQPHAVINQCNTLPWTRTYDHAWFLDENPAETVVTREYPLAHDDTNEPFYPMPFGDGMEIHARYKALARNLPHTLFLGRLATYSYLDMWMAVAQAVTLLRHHLSPADRKDLLKPSLQKTTNH